MTLKLDISRAIRTLAEQQALVQAIADAPTSEQESDWLEWKTDVDLSTKAWQATTARHILGFANRHPDTAAQWSEGCAYAALGVAPGQLQGTRVHDIAKLNAWLSAYVGLAPDAPQWSATYVDMGTAQVLLVTIEKPRWGDPIWTFQKEYTPPKPRPPMRAGTIYVRRRGSTDQAEPAEIKMLTDRAGSGPRRLSLSVRLTDNDAAVPIDTSETLLNAWADAERATLMPPPPRVPSQPTRITNIQKEVAESVLAITAALTAKAAFAETRTPEAFAHEVVAYVDKARLAMPTALARGAVRHRFGRLRALLENETEHNFSQVVVEIHFDQPDVRAYFEESTVKGPDFPSRPAAWGSQTLPSILPRGLTQTIRYPSMGSITMPRSPKGTIDNSGSSRIRFDPVDVRPMHSHRLETIYLVVGADFAGAVVEGTWLATASDTSGVARGKIAVPVASEVPTYKTLLSRPPATDDEDE